MSAPTSASWPRSAPDASGPPWGSQGGPLALASLVLGSLPAARTGGRALAGVGGAARSVRGRARGGGVARGDPVAGLVDRVGRLVGDLLHALAGAGGDLLVPLPARLGAEDVADRGADQHAELADHLHVRPPSPSGDCLSCLLAGHSAAPVKAQALHAPPGRRREAGQRSGRPADR